jgi:hypothetical protein
VGASCSELGVMDVGDEAVGRLGVARPSAAPRHAGTLVTATSTAMAAPRAARGRILGDNRTAVGINSCTSERTMAWVDTCMLGTRNAYSGQQGAYRA